MYLTSANNVTFAKGMHLSFALRIKFTLLFDTGDFALVIIV